MVIALGILCIALMVFCIILIIVLCALILNAERKDSKRSALLLELGAINRKLSLTSSLLENCKTSVSVSYKIEKDVLDEFNALLARIKLNELITRINENTMLLARTNFDPKYIKKENIEVTVQLDEYDQLLWKFLFKNITKDRDARRGASNHMEITYFQ